MPMIDDGAIDNEEFIKMLKIAIKSGVKGIVATPHFGYRFKYITKELILKRFESSKKLIIENNLDIELFLGSENFFSYNIVDLVKKDLIMTINNSRYILIEFDMYRMPQHYSMVLCELISNGYIPIIAHPERYKYYRVSNNDIENIIGFGCIIQVNASSLMGKHGYKIKQNVYDILNKTKRIIIASDAHSSKKRNTNMSKAFKIVNKKYGKEFADKIFCENSSRIINNIVL